MIILYTVDIMNPCTRLIESFSARKKPVKKDSLELSHHPSLVIQNAEDARVHLVEARSP